MTSVARYAKGCNGGMNVMRVLYSILIGQEAFSEETHVWNQFTGEVMSIRINYC